MPGDTKQLCPRIVLPTKLGEPLRPPAQNCGGDGDGLDICHDGRTAPKTNIGRERRFQARFARLAFKTLNETCLFTTNVGPSTTVNNNVEFVARSARIVSKIASLVCLLNCSLNGEIFVVELTANVNVCCSRPHGKSCDQGSFDQLVGFHTHNFSVLTGTRLRFIGVDNDIGGPAISRRCLGHERPLQSRRETSTTTASQT
mmetsp:Transcript_99986/g.172520  ORF Transcript_99986/g.172520 Transcript_99986/m.172520 type:complete len:201 (-) Transcript_99986:266-868(-)